MRIYQSSNTCGGQKFSRVVNTPLLVWLHVEASFSWLNDVINRKSNRMGIETYSGIMDVKKSLQMKTSSALYPRMDP